MPLPDCTHKSDEELIQLVIQDQDYFYCLIKRYEKKLLFYILRLTNTNRENAEDILQEVFLKIYKNILGFDSNLKFSSWAYRITHNETISHFRKIQNKNTTISLDDIEQNQFINLLESSFDVKKEFHSQEIIQQVQKTIFELPLKYREILVLRYIENKDYQEISDILQKPMGTVATLINRAKIKFKKTAQKNHLNELI